MSHYQIERLIAEEPEVGLRAAEVLSERQALYGNRIADIGFKEVPARLASLLVQLIKSEGVKTLEGYEILTYYTQEQMGAMIEARRVAVTRAFGKLQRAGVVELRRRRIYVKDVNALRAGYRRLDVSAKWPKRCNQITPKGARHRAVKVPAYTDANF